MKVTLFIVLTLLCAGCNSSSADRIPTTEKDQPAPTPAATNNAIDNNTEIVNQKSKQVPQSFKDVDFKNHSYGRYRLWGRKRMNLRLEYGRRNYEFPDCDKGWFSFDEVYYADVTKDKKPEAIVLLSHVSCGCGSCDGGAHMIYIYQVHQNKLRRLWQYETGSMAYGCGLKSLTIKGGNIAMEQFGRCPRPATDYPGSHKAFVADLTQLNFRFRGNRFVRTSMKYISVPEREVRNYQPAIRIE